MPGVFMRGDQPLAVRRPAHFVEQAVLQAGALDGLQEVLGDDHVGVDIDHIERRRDAGELREFFHCSSVTDLGIIPPRRHHPVALFARSG